MSLGCIHNNGDRITCKVRRKMRNKPSLRIIASASSLVTQQRSVSLAKTCPALACDRSLQCSLDASIEIIKLFKRYCVLLGRRSQSV